MENSYFDPEKLVDDSDEFYYLDLDNYLEYVGERLFHIGQSYTNGVCDTMYCKHCGGKVFNVGTDDYFTAIKCVTCKYEICVHDG